MAQYETFSEVRARLDEIVTQVRKKDLSLEKSLDLYEEAIKLETAPQSSLTSRTSLTRS